MQKEAKFVGVYADKLRTALRVCHAVSANSILDCMGSSLEQYWQHSRVVSASTALLICIM